MKPAVLIRVCRDRLPSRLVVAWALLGAAAENSLMYSEWVFDRDVDIWMIRDGNLRVPPLSRQGMVSPSVGWVKVGGMLVYEGQDNDSAALSEEVVRWHRR